MYIYIYIYIYNINAGSNNSIHGSNNMLLYNMHDSHNPIKTCLLFYIEIVHDKNILTSICKDLVS